MATLTIRGLDDELRAKLRVRAAGHGRSMEAEVREILRTALSAPTDDAGLGRRIRQRFAAVGSVEIELPARHEAPRAPDLGR